MKKPTIPFEAVFLQTEDFLRQNVLRASLIISCFFYNKLLKT